VRDAKIINKKGVIMININLDNKNMSKELEHALISNIHAQTLSHLEKTEESPMHRHIKDSVVGATHMIEHHDMQDRMNGREHEIVAE
jgi:hypothetical protein